MKIVYITQTLPLPLDTGGNIKAYSTITLLKKMGHDVVIFSFVNDIEKLKYEEKLISEGFKIGKTIVNPLLRADKRQNLLNELFYYCLNVFSLKPFTIIKFYNNKMETAVKEYLNKEKVDCFWINCLSMSQYLPENYKALKILELLDVESEFYKRMFLKDAFLRWKIYALFEWIKFYLFERMQYSKFDKIFTISEFDKRLIKNRNKRNNISVLPPVIKIKRISKAQNTKNNLLFLGNLCWYPNKDGIYWFLTKIYPKLNNEINNLQINIVGQLPRRDIFPKYENVHFHGYQKNLEKFYQQATIFFVPIRYGSGLRIKILEAMSRSIPVISTHEGAEGLGVKNGREILLVNSEEDFRDKILLLLKDRNLQVKLIRNAYFLLGRNYSLQNHKILNHTL